MFHVVQMSIRKSCGARAVAAASYHHCGTLISSIAGSLRVLLRKKFTMQAFGKYGGCVENKRREKCFFATCNLTSSSRFVLITCGF